MYFFEVVLIIETGNFDDDAADLLLCISIWISGIITKNAIRSIFEQLYLTTPPDESGGF
jgi:hypothetical protein